MRRFAAFRSSATPSALSGGVRHSSAASQATVPSAAAPNLTYALYRRLLRDVKAIDRYCGGNVDHVCRSVFGTLLHADQLACLGFGTSAMDLARRMFRWAAAGRGGCGSVGDSGSGGDTPSLTVLRHEEMFWMLRQCAMALPQKGDADDFHIRLPTKVVFFGNMSVISVGERVANSLANAEVLSVAPKAGKLMPPSRIACVPTESFFPAFVSQTEKLPVAWLLFNLEVASATHPSSSSPLSSPSLLPVLRPPSFRSLLDMVGQPPGTRSVCRSACGRVEVECRTQWLTRRMLPQPQDVGGWDNVNSTHFDNSSVATSTPSLADRLRHPDAAAADVGGQRRASSAPLAAHENVFKYIVSIRYLGESSQLEGAQSGTSPSTRQKPAPARKSEGLVDSFPAAAATNSGSPPPTAVPAAAAVGGAKKLLLLSRHWYFVDVSEGSLVEVVGPGVVGQFPVLSCGECHTYDSGTAFRGDVGFMKGTFQFVEIPVDIGGGRNAAAAASASKRSDKGKKVVANGGPKPSSRKARRHIVAEPLKVEAVGDEGATPPLSTSAKMQTDSRKRATEAATAVEEAPQPSAVVEREGNVDVQKDGTNADDSAEDGDDDEPSIQLDIVEVRIPCTRLHAPVGAATSRLPQ